MSDLTPDADTLAQLQRDARPGPVTLLNLLEFKGEAGRTAFNRYGALVGALVQECGGEVVLAGEAGTVLAGEGGWDMVIAVRFPDVEHFVRMVTHEQYQAEAVPLREQALIRTLWMAVQPAAE